ncbi:hypothetical protein Hypma_011626 [Hypsizygus marmoreus]|uniref:Phorbol-ester/DAG-type domain-containing protein n=1 Tax=Hypsizygus marmoreus TaxID=39966 RepID=A0A369JGT5_HYPMA|nr:hypothetical protein Hypma_011626 [Hypsizygus marmoreus]
MNASTPPSLRIRVPQIDTNPQHAGNFTSPLGSPTFAVSNGNDIPSLRISTSPQTEAENLKSPTSPSAFRTQFHSKLKTNSRAKTESRKLLAHVLGQLDRRNLPPLIYDAFDDLEDPATDNNLVVLMETVKDAVRLRSKRKDAKLSTQTGTTGALDDDSDDDDERVFSTDATYDLMLQLRDVLIMSVDQGWHILDDESPARQNDEHESGGKINSPFRRPRNSLQPGGRRSRSPSPAGKQIHAPELLSLCISIIASIVMEDCRYRIASPRPSRPPNALQALTLDIAQFLLYTHRHDPNIITKIGFAVIPAFSTFQPEMHGRLITFFETSILRGMLEDLRQIQGVNDIVPTIGSNEDPSHASGTSPIVSIHIDTVQETPHSESGSQWVPWSRSPPSATKVQSTDAPFQSLSLYYLSSLVAPLIATILECVELDSTSDSTSDVLYRFRRLLKFIVDMKVDAYGDILRVVGYHTPKARRSAVDILMTFWPNAVGHVIVSKPFTQAYLIDNPRLHSMDKPHAHQFTPWRFNPKTARPGLKGFSLHDCRSCANIIHGFGLLCPLCMCAVHFDCYDYPEGSHVHQYALASDRNVQRMAMYRFSYILLDRSRNQSGLVRKHRHTFRLVNLFTLCLCFVCRMPLWGCNMQGLSCSSCFQFVHSACISHSELPRCSSTNITSDHMTIDWTELRHSCLDFHRDILQLSNEELGARSFEEISIIHAIAWTQLQIITNGVALGSIVVMQNGRSAAHAMEHRVNEFELHRVVRWCETHLASDRLQCSDTLYEFMVENRLARSEHFMMFDWSNLLYICSIAKSPCAPQHVSCSSSSDLLNVTQPDVIDNRLPSQTFEVVSLSHIRDALGAEFNVHSDITVRLILSHLHHLGLFSRIDHNSLLLDFDDVKEIYCLFPLPLGLDLSTNVEILVSAVEASLSDLDLSVNEFGFLLLVRRLWPNGLASDYALRRLTRSILSWILAEDDRLAIILRDYLAKQKSLPGVRSAKDSVPWPSSQSSRPTPSSSSNNGGDYIAARRTLLSQYVKPWLLALHDQDAKIYAGLIYESCIDTEGFSSGVLGALSDVATKEQLLSQCDKALRWITRLSQVSVAFTIFDELLLLWLESVSIHKLYEEPMSSLFRLFPRETEASNRYSVGLDQVFIPENLTTIDPWRVVMRIATESSEGLSRSLQWLCLFTRSGVEVPLAIFKVFFSQVAIYDSSVSDSLILAKSVLSSTWLKSVGRQELQAMFSELHARLACRIANSLKTGTQVDDSISFIRISLGTCLLLYGCERSKLIELDVIKKEDIQGLPSRRKLNARGSVVVDPIIIDPQLMEALELYITPGIDDLSCLVAKFLNLFLTDSPYLESYEVDNFILRNGRFLASWPGFFQPAVGNDAVTRLFRIILDVTSPYFNVENRQWRSSVADIFYFFFSAMWGDQQEEIRIAVNSFSSSLLPAHFEAISSCWNESLSKAPVSERVRLVAFLIQLRPYFPTWKVLSWEAIVEALLEDDYESRNGYNDDGPAAAHLQLQSLYGLSSGPQSGSEKYNDPDMATLRVSIILLSLQMIADGIAVDSFTLLKIKTHLVRVTGFSEVSVVPSHSGHSFQVQFGEVSEIPEIAHPCVYQLLPVLDAHHPVELTPSAMAGANILDERPVPVLVGSIFVDVSLAMFCTVRDLSSLPVSTLKSLLETICVIIYKHDFESRALRHLQQTLRRAVMRALDILSEDISYDLRQLALSVTQAFIRRWHNFMGSIVYTTIESAARLIASQNHHGQDALAAQAQSLIDTTLTTYAQNGLFTNLLKRQLSRDFFVVLKQVMDTNAKSNPLAPQALRELLLRDVLGRAAETDQAAFQVLLNNIQTYVEVVFHQNYSADLMLFVGQQLTHLARRMSEWTPDVIDPAPLIFVCATVIQHNKARSRDMLSYVDTVMRVLLNRLNVSTESSSRLLQVTATLYRKTHPNDSTPSMNSVLHLMFEVLADGLRLKARVLPSTIKSMIDAITTTEISGSLPPITQHLSSLIGLVDPGIHFLQAHPWQDVSSESDFAASLGVAKLLLQVAGQDPTVMNKLSDYGTERSTHTNLRVRAWNMLALSALMEPKENWYTTLLAQLPSFSYAHHAAMRVYAQSTTSASESAMIDINHAYIGIKLWVLLAQKASTSDSAGDLKTFSVWNELWPPFESIINVFEVEARAGQSLTLGTLVISSIADLLIFLRTAHTPVALHTSMHIATLNRLRNLAPGETITAKLTRALRYMSEPPPEVSFDSMVNQAGKEIVAAEKLRILESRLAQDRRVPERHRREMRATT